MRILVVEDELHLQKTICKRLEMEHYSVDACDNGLEALDYIEMTPYDIIILDIMMPGIDGLEVLRRIRASGNRTPVLFLTARDSIQDRVSGLDTGADDYLVKPFAFDELLARIRAAIRRHGSSQPVSNELKLSDLVLDCASHAVSRGGKSIELSAKEYSILEYMMRHQGIVLSREQLEQHAWNYDYMGGSNIVDVYIRYLRKKIDADFEQKLIHTVRGIGYVLRIEE